MENRNTLRSQTVQCTHCGEYYSVTYDYCPFCDAGRKESDKKKTGSLFNTLFGLPEEERQSHPPERSRRESGSKRPPRREESRHSAAPERYATGRVERLPAAQEAREERPARRRDAREDREKRSRSREDREKRRERRAPQRREELLDDDLPRVRKKTSEMTESERAANRAEREARAAQRKRERERAAAEAEARARAKQAEQAILSQQQQAAGGETVGPVFETMMPPESFGFETDASGSILPRDTGAFSTTQTGMTFRTFTIPLKGATGPIPGVTEPEAAPPPPEAEAPEAAKPAKAKEPEGVLSEEEASSWAALRSLEDTGGTEVEVTDDTSALVPTGKDQQPPPQAAPAQPVQAQAPQPAAPQPQPAASAPPAPPPQDSPRGAEKVIPIQSRVQDTKPTPPAAPAAAAAAAAEAGSPAPAAAPAAPAQPVQEAADPAPAEAQTPPPAEEPSDPEQDLDALLNEIREMIANSPVPVLEEEEELPPPSVEESLEPTIIRSVYPSAQAEPAAEKDATQPWKAEEVPQAAPAAEEAVPAETPAELPEDPQEDEEELEERDTAISFSFWRKKKAEEADGAQTEDAAADGAEAQVPKKKHNPLPLALSLLFIAAAVLIVATRFVPAMQTGVFGQLIGRIGQIQVSDDTAQTFTLDKKDLLFTEKGKTETLVPVFAPEGTTAALGWSSSDAQVASVDENGVVTTVGPGTATITASMSSGESAQCIIRCNWNGGEPSAEGEAPAESQDGATQDTQGDPGGVGLSAAQLTIDAPGDSKQLTLNGAAGEVKWTSDSNTIATVSTEGLVSAVGIGVANITATYEGQAYTCQVRCIW